ncbi:hypothetical protein BofuT4_uP151590.1 [Botrytis cinerea T4]|uniref:Uncharacterized protein n=1 Tax=Botryotinia fuckeliana (strain T4) TaxID=999810 RepID=G2YWM9_BOTF4|nr:hypothetical protein BofuT4_uP151590.1 [Botrytis cinerea T4]
MKEKVDRERLSQKRTYTADGSAESTCALISCRSLKSYDQCDVVLRIINAGDVVVVDGVEFPA